MEEEPQRQRSQLGTYRSFLQFLLRTSFHPASFSTWNADWRNQDIQETKRFLTWSYLLLWTTAPHRSRRQSHTEPYTMESSGLATSPETAAVTGGEMEVVKECLTDWPRARLLACGSYCLCRTSTRSDCSPAGGSCWGWWAAAPSFAGGFEGGTRSEAVALQLPSSSCKHWHSVPALSTQCYTKCELFHLIIELLRPPLWECRDMEVPHCAQNKSFCPAVSSKLEIREDWTYFNCLTKSSNTETQPRW